MQSVPKNMGQPYPMHKSIQYFTGTELPYPPNNPSVGPIVLHNETLGAPDPRFQYQFAPNHSYVNYHNGPHPNHARHRSIERKNVRKQSKYNCYSCLDEPYQRVRNTGCNGALQCPPNQCIASDYKYTWFQ